MSSHRILYVGKNEALSAYLQSHLADCRIVRSPGESTVSAFIAHINYSVLLFDEELPNTTGRELAEFSCSLAREICTPFIIVKKPDDFESVAKAIMEVLAV